jgi:hypothetical protein
MAPEEGRIAMRTERLVRYLTCAAVAVLVLLTAGTAHGAPLILNGGFESGFASWTRADQLGSEGTFFLQTGTSSPVNLVQVPAPSQGVQAAMSDAQGPGSHVLYQDFVVPADAAAGTLSFQLFIGNRAGMFVTPNTLDFSTPTLNQQARVDILRAGTDPFSLLPADVLLNVYRTNTGNPAISGYNTIVTDLSALLAANAGNMLRLRFAETDNVFTFQFGVDAVSLETSPIPEPVTGLLIGTGLAGLAARCRWRQGSKG